MNAHAELISTDNGLGVYDTAAKITWTADANLLGTMEANAIAQYGNDNSLINTISNGNISAEFGGNGTANVYGAFAFVTYLNDIVYGNSNKWSLPTNTQGFDSHSSSFFINVQSEYWTSTQSSTNYNFNWVFNAIGGENYGLRSTDQLLIWAVSPGNVVAPVPLPTSAWMFLTGFVGWLGFKRRKQ